MAQILLAVTPDGLGLKTCTAGLLARGSLGVSGLPEPCGPVADRSPSPLTVAGAAGGSGAATGSAHPHSRLCSGALRRVEHHASLVCPFRKPGVKGAKGGGGHHDGYSPASAPNRMTAAVEAAPPRASCSASSAIVVRTKRSSGRPRDSANSAGVLGARPCAINFAASAGKVRRPI